MTTSQVQQQGQKDWEPGETNLLSVTPVSCQCTAAAERASWLVTRTYKLHGALLGMTDRLCIEPGKTVLGGVTYCQKCLFFVFCNHDEFPTLKSVLPPSTSLNNHLLSAGFSLLISFQIKQIDWIYWVSHHQACFMDHSFTELCSSFELLPIFQHQF